MAWYLEFIVNARTKQVLEAARGLSVEERAEIAHALLDSLDGECAAEDADVVEEVNKAWALEIQRRVEAVDAGLVKTVSVEGAMARASQAIRRAR
ncbi:MAG: addiction module protein [Myxococcales bacterium]|nr:addiction module protein [Myxococcales bacterium]